MYDGNLYALNQYLSGEEQAEKALESYWEDVDDITTEIQELIERLYKIADNYEYGNCTYDFTDNVKEMIKYDL